MATKLFIGSLPFSATEDQLREMFAQSGTVVSATIITDKFSGRSRGFGFVEMNSEEEAKAAVEKFNGSAMEGRNIVVNEARPMEDRGGSKGGFGGGSRGGSRGGFNR
ncbi:MAG: RNA-binding protein [Patescibacteria group bacterium]